MGNTQDGGARMTRGQADTLPEHPALDATIAALDLAPPPALARREPRTTPESSGLELAPPSTPQRQIVPVVDSSMPPPRSAPGRDIEREERAKRRTTLLVVASLWTCALALVGTLLFMIAH